MIVLILHATKVMFKIFQTRFHQYLNWELPNIQAGFRKAEEPEIRLSMEILEKEMATHSSILLWRIPPMDREAWWPQCMGSQELDTTEAT